MGYVGSEDPGAHRAGKHSRGETDWLAYYFPHILKNSGEELWVGSNANHKTSQQKRG